MPQRLRRQRAIEDAGATERATVDESDVLA